ncbi:MAG TPA: alkaline phosphatase family protein [Rhizomicrobium sp.]
MPSFRTIAATSFLLACASTASFAAEMPRYAHIFVIIAENRGYDEMARHPEWTPHLAALAKEYGQASQFFAEDHPSEGNYVAMVGGDTFGIKDDDAFFCKPGLKNEFCEKSSKPDYADHSIAAKSIADQLAAKGLDWKAYVEDIPAAGSLVPRWPTSGYAVKGLPSELYAAKHNGFVNFKSVHEAPYPELMKHLVGFAQLDADLAAGEMPAYAHIVPNQCNDMHGLHKDESANVPEDCESESGLIRRGDAVIGRLVAMITGSKVWSAPGNTAIVVTYDENDDEGRQSGPQGCCGYDPKSLANFGGGHIQTLVITNHGPRHLVDPTRYNHYSLLRTTEDAFGIHEYLGHAADSAKGVVSMAPLFAVSQK